MPETRDADFSWQEFQARHNNELADILGNFVNRTFTFIGKYFNGALPSRGNPDKLDQELINTIAAARDGVGEALDNFQFKEGLKRLMDLARFANKYFNDKEPWRTRKSDPEQCATTLNLCAQTAHALTVLMNPFLPFTSKKVWKMLQLPGNPEEAAWDEAASLALKEGHKLGELEILFQKIEDKQIQKEVERIRRIQEEMKKEKAVAKREYISIEEFQRIDLRSARVIAVEAIPKAKKLLKLQIDLGTEKRQLVAGLAEHYQPEELVGKTIIIVANLQPATIRGVESQGMLLAVEDKGRLVFVTAEKSVSAGKKVS
jgi:methionyl-tRNA synthetase